MLQFVTVFLILIIFKNSHCNDTISPPKIIAYEPHGIRISLTDTDGVSEFFFWGNVNKELEGTDLGDITLGAFEPNDDGQWVIEDEEIPLKRGDVIHYILFVKIHGVMRKLERMSYEVSETVPWPPTTTSSATETTPSTTTPPSSTTATTTTLSTTTTATTTSTTTTATTTTTTEATVTPMSSSTLPPTTPATSTTTKPSPCMCVKCPEILIEVDNDSVKYFEKTQAQSKKFELVKDINTEEVSVINIDDCSIEVEKIPEGSPAGTLDINIF